MSCKGWGPQSKADKPCGLPRLLGAWPFRWPTVRAQRPLDVLSCCSLRAQPKKDLSARWATWCIILNSVEKSRNLPMHWAFWLTFKRTWRRSTTLSPAYLVRESLLALCFHPLFGKDHDLGFRPARLQYSGCQRNLLSELDLPDPTATRAVARDALVQNGHPLRTRARRVMRALDPSRLPGLVRTTSVVYVSSPSVSFSDMRCSLTLFCSLLVRLILNLPPELVPRGADPCGFLLLRRAVSEACFPRGPTLRSSYLSLACRSCGCVLRFSLIAPSLPRSYLCCFVLLLFLPYPPLAVAWAEGVVWLCTPSPPPQGWCVWAFRLRFLFLAGCSVTTLLFLLLLLLVLPVLRLCTPVWFSFVGRSC